MNIDYPYGFDGRGRTAETNDDEHIRDLVEQVLFTSPGERVNRPTFGCGLLQLVFEPNNEALAAATQFLVHGALQQWLGDVIEVGDVTVLNDASVLAITVRYTVRRTLEEKTARFTRPGVI